MPRISFSLFHRVALLACFCAAPAFAQQTVVIAPAKDATIYDGNTTNSAGGGAHLYVGNNNQGNARRGLVAFDVAGELPEGATVTEVTVSFRVAKFSGGAAGLVMLLPLTTDWGEGTADPGSTGGKGAASSAGDATWTDAFAGTTSWLTPGGDFMAMSSATQALTRGTAAYTLASNDLLVADVQRWLDTPSTNFGWMLVGDEVTTKTVVQLDSREGSGTPMALSVTYTMGTANETEDAVVLSQPRAYPNPTHGAATLAYRLEAPASVRVTVLDLLGREVLRPVDGPQRGGDHAVPVDLSAFPAGLYLYTVTVGTQRATGRLTHIR